MKITNIKQYIRSYSKNHKHIFLYVLIPFISAIIGGVVGLALLPIQKNIEYSFWEKQNRELVKQHVIEKRLDLLNQLIVELSIYSVCSARTAGTIHFKTNDVEAFECFINSSSKIEGLALQIKYYYDKPVVERFDKISDYIQDFENSVNSGFEKESSKGINFWPLMEDTIKLMQSRMLAGL